jgi:hypothetical protein
MTNKPQKYKQLIINNLQENKWLFSSLFQTQKKTIKPSFDKNCTTENMQKTTKSTDQF